MVTLRDGPPRKERCGRPNCPTCYPVADGPRMAELMAQEPDAPPTRTPTKTQQAKAAILAATGVSADSLDERPDPVVNLTELDDDAV